MTTKPNFCPTCGAELAQDDDSTIKVISSSRTPPVKYAVHCGRCNNSATIEDRTSSSS
jgi:hypothetical protein